VRGSNSGQGGSDTGHAAAHDDFAFDAFDPMDTHALDASSVAHARNGDVHDAFVEAGHPPGQEGADSVEHSDVRAGLPDRAPPEGRTLAGMCVDGDGLASVGPPVVTGDLSPDDVAVDRELSQHRAGEHAPIWFGRPRDGALATGGRGCHRTSLAPAQGQYEFRTTGCGRCDDVRDACGRELQTGVAIGGRESDLW
jgi:hypothetical protein